MPFRKQDLTKLNKRVGKLLYNCFGFTIFKNVDYFFVQSIRYLLYLLTG